MPKERRHHRLAAAIALALTITLTAACGAGTDAPTGPATAEPTTANPTTEVTPDEPDRTPSGEDSGSGWQEADFGGGTFSVPPTWEIETYSADGEESERAVHGRGQCPENDRLATGLAFVTWTEGETDAATAAVDEIDRAVDSYYGDRSPEVELGDMQQSESWVRVAAGVTLAASDDPCDAPEAMLIVLAAPYLDGSGSLLFLVLGELGLDGSPPVDDLIGIADSLVV